LGLIPKIVTDYKFWYRKNYKMDIENTTEFEINMMEFEGSDKQVSLKSIPKSDHKSLGFSFDSLFYEATGGTGSQNPQIDNDQAHTNFINQLDQEKLKELLDRVYNLVIPASTETMTAYARSLVKNRRRVCELYSVLHGSDIYLPPLSCKRVTYKYLLGIVEKRHLAISRTKVLAEPCPFPLKIPAKVIVFEINKISKLIKMTSGYHLSRPFPYNYYVEVLYKLDPTNRLFPKVNVPLIPEDNQPNVNEVVDQLIGEIPLPETFRGLIRFERQKIKALLYAGLFGGNMGMAHIQNRLASLSNNVEKLRRVLISLKKDMQHLNGALTAEQDLDTIIKLLVP